VAAIAVNLGFPVPWAIGFGISGSISHLHLCHNPWPARGADLFQEKNFKISKPIKIKVVKNSRNIIKFR
jgi:hypothetical protein